MNDFPFLPPNIFPEHFNVVFFGGGKGISHFGIAQKIEIRERARLISFHRLQKPTATCCRCSGNSRKITTIHVRLAFHSMEMATTTEEREKDFLHSDAVCPDFSDPKSAKNSNKRKKKRQPKMSKFLLPFRTIQVWFTFFDIFVS